MKISNGSSTATLSLAKICFPPLYLTMEISVVFSPVLSFEVLPVNAFQGVFDFLPKPLVMLDKLLAVLRNL